MSSEKKESAIISKQIFKLLPIQILMAAVPALSGFISGIFANNFISPDSMSVVGLYAPVVLILTTVSTMLMGGSLIYAAQYLGMNKHSRTNGIFTLDLIASAVLSVLISALLIVLGMFDLTAFFGAPDELRPLFNSYIIGQGIGIIPWVMGVHVSAFLSLENKIKRTTISSIVYVVINVILDVVFIVKMKMGVFGLSLASSIGLWVMLVIQIQYYFSSKCTIKFSIKELKRGDLKDIIKIGLPGSLGNGYQSIRRVIVNALIMKYVGPAGMSAFSTADSLIGLFWSIPGAMQNVTRMMFGISAGEEDKETLIGIMKVALKQFFIVLVVLAGILALLAVPLTEFYFKDPSEPVYQMTVLAFRILPFVLPAAIGCMSFTSFGQALNKQVLLHILSVADGVLGVSLFSLVMIPAMGITGFYWANILNSVMAFVIIIIYSWIVRKKIPLNTEALMAIPDSFGASEDNRIDISITRMEEVIQVSKQVQDFCNSKGLDKMRSFLAGLSMEEIASNVVGHGFTKDKKKHAIDVRVSLKDDTLILRVKDNCRPFDPETRLKITNHEDKLKNVGIKMVFKIAKKVTYQNILGLNVLTIKM